MDSLRLTYNSSISDIHEVNSSFDAGVLRICYTGTNRNRTYFSKSTLEKAIPTIYNCPIVAHYYREDGSIGGHDIEVITDYDNQLRVVNLTQPVGVIPESANVYFTEVVEDDGTVHEYLCADVILWKRQEAYKAIKENGITSESMEITVKDGENFDDVYVVNDFEFTAFALLGDCEPCFESASLQTYSFVGSEFKAEFAEMMNEFKECFELATTSEEVDKTLSKKGGYALENDKLENFEITDEEVTDTNEVAEDNIESADDDVEDNYALNSAFRESLFEALNAVSPVVHSEWGDYPQYDMADYDTETNMVYVWDNQDWLLYGFHYEMNGDNVVIDVNSKKRMKYVIAEYDEGDNQASPFVSAFEQVKAFADECNKIRSDVQAKYEESSESLAAASSELDELRKFKSDTEAESNRAQREELLSQFSDLTDVEEFATLVREANELSIDELEEKCYAIRGRNVKLNFSTKDSKTPRLPIGTVRDSDKSDVPYGGIVEKYLGR